MKSAREAMRSARSTQTVKLPHTVEKDIGVSKVDKFIFSPLSMSYLSSSLSKSLSKILLSAEYM